MNWRKSEFSISGDCVEIGGWRKSEFSADGTCVEVGSGQAVIGVRDTTDPARTVTLKFPSGAWERFLDGLR